jgi:arabinan endo-1,5-alpha-L-arabinosidase
LSKEKAPTNSKPDQYPLPNQSNVTDHDPNIFEYNDSFYVFHGGVNIPITKAPSLDGPWTSAGTVLNGPSIIDKEDRNRPWAPTTFQHNGSFYCFYSISIIGTRNSSIGVATTDSLDGGKWTDHGALINSVSGNLSNIYPYNVSNAVDASFIVDNATGKPYLNYGSYWHGIYQVPLAADLLSVEDPEHPRAVNLAYDPTENRALEGPWMNFRDPYYYLWISHGIGTGQKAKAPPASGASGQELVASLRFLTGC